MWTFNVWARNEKGAEIMVSGLKAENPFWFLDKSVKSKPKKYRHDPEFIKAVNKATVDDMLLANDLRAVLKERNLYIPFGRWFADRLRSFGFIHSVRVRVDDKHTRLYYKDGMFYQNETAANILERYKLAKENIKW